MGRAHDLEPELGEVGIENIEQDLRSRIPALLIGLQDLCSDEDFRARLFGLMDEHLLPGVDRTVGRPGMEMWRILVMGVVKQGLGCDFKPPPRAGEPAQDAAPVPFRVQFPCGVLGV